MRACAKTLESELAEDELSFLLETIHASNYEGKHVEIGTAAGGTLWRMIEKVRADNPHRFVVVDPMKYFTDQLTLVQKNVYSRGISLDRVDFRIASSEEAFEDASRELETFDFIFIDGNHKLRYVAQDLRWARLLNAGGKLALHDYSSAHPG